MTPRPGRAVGATVLALAFAIVLLWVGREAVAQPTTSESVPTTAAPTTVPPTTAPPTTSPPTTAAPTTARPTTTPTTAATTTASTTTTTVTVPSTTSAPASSGSDTWFTVLLVVLAVAALIGAVVAIVLAARGRQRSKESWEGEVRAALVDVDLTVSVTTTHAETPDPRPFSQVITPRLQLLRGRLESLAAKAPSDRLREQVGAVASGVGSFGFAAEAEWMLRKGAVMPSAEQLSQAGAASFERRAALEQAVSALRAEIGDPTATGMAYPQASYNPQPPYTRTQPQAPYGTAPTTPIEQSPTAPTQPQAPYNEPTRRYDG